MHSLHFEQLEPRNMLAADVALIQNPLDAPDVNNDNQITPVDALSVINRLNNLAPAPDHIQYFMDVNGDRHISSIDALEIIDRLNHPDSFRRMLFSEIRDAGADSYQLPANASQAHQSLFQDLRTNWLAFQDDAGPIHTLLDELRNLARSDRPEIINKINSIHKLVKLHESQLTGTINQHNVSFSDVIDVIAARKPLSELGVDQNPQAAESFRGVAATHIDYAYGDHARNKFDIWLADADQPTPLVAFIHGGGFISGDKSGLYDSLRIDTFLNRGVSVATINYRFQTNPNLDRPFTPDDVTVLDSIHDSMRAVQTIRHNADAWNIDTSQLAAYGASAGAGTSLWLGFHDDLADTNSNDPIARQSTRLSAVGALNTQFTYDIRKWPAVLGIPQAWADAQLQHLTAAELLILDELDFHDMITPDDPAVYVKNKHPNAGTPALNDLGHIQHHPNHAQQLKIKAEDVGLDGSFTIPALNVEPADGEYELLVDFLLSQFDS
ncbi:MAG: dockerin type I domain-containing protein [Pirellulaceae bacterium]|nr:dockerin type I domain-containing protein [Pirellulaceae bacterium]